MLKFFTAATVWVPIRLENGPACFCPSSIKRTTQVNTTHTVQTETVEDKNLPNTETTLMVQLPHDGAIMTPVRQP